MATNWKATWVVFLIYSLAVVTYLSVSSASRNRFLDAGKEANATITYVYLGMARGGVRGNPAQQTANELDVSFNVNGVAYEDQIPATRSPTLPRQGEEVSVTYLPNDPKQAALTETRPSDNTQQVLLGLALVILYPIVVAIYVVIRRISPAPSVDI